MFMWIKINYSCYLFLLLFWSVGYAIKYSNVKQSFFYFSFTHSLLAMISTSDAIWPLPASVPRLLFSRKHNHADEVDFVPIIVVRPHILQFLKCIKLTIKKWWMDLKVSTKTYTTFGKLIYLTIHLWEFLLVLHTPKKKWKFSTNRKANERLKK